MDKFGHYYLAPTEIDSTDPIDTKNKGFSFDDLQEAIEDTRSRRVITILDCCYSGAARLREGIIGSSNKNELKNSQKLEDLTDDIKQSLIHDYKICYSDNIQR